MKMFSYLALALTLAVGSFTTIRAYAGDDKADKKPAMACCGDACKKMEGCCKADDKGKVTCSMGGDCCVKTEPKK